ncbi:MAG TPA: HEAT repeat domain-containing protein [Kofleriaceae bacterium]|jgi:hypothetical protein
MRAALLLLVPSLAAAAPFAGVQATLDGKSVSVAVDDGALKVDGAIVATLGSPAAATVDARDLPGHGPAILVTLANKEAIGFEKHGTWKQLFRVPIGPADEDGDYGIAVALLDRGFYRYQTRQGLHRCDGKPALLFAEGWNGSKFQRLASIEPEVDASARPLAAQPSAATAPAPLLYHATLASREAGTSDVTGLIAPRELDDGNADTSWTDAGKPHGQFFTFEPRCGAKASELRIVAPEHGSLPSSLAIVGANATYRVALPAAVPKSAFVIELPSPIAGCVSAVIESDAPASIGELEVFGDSERATGGEPALAECVAAGADGAMAAQQALASRGAAAVTALETSLAAAKDALARGRVLRALIATNDPSAGPVLAKAARELRLRDDDLDAVLAALGTLGQTTELARLAASGDLEMPARAAAVRAIATAPGDHAAQLVPLAGTGPTELRGAVIDALATAPVAELASAAATAPSSAAAGDLWRAVTRRGRANPSERAAAAAALAAALPGATDYERRYRILDGLATLGDATALAQAADALHRMNGAEHAAIGQVVAHALASSPRPEALPLALELARNADPGVRAAAVTALADDAWHDADKIDTVLESALASDTWPELRRHAAEVLGARCERSGPARALAISVGRDPEVTVRDGALVALVQCKAPGTGALLAMVWDDAKLPLELRQRAVQLAATLGDPALGDKLVARLASWRGAALESADALALAQSAAYAVGQLAPAGAADALQAALGDVAYPEIVAAAASGLGLLGPKCPPQAKAKLRALSQNEERQIALAAGRAAKQCGR